MDTVKGKKVLFITTKNIDYIRNAQEIKLLKETAGQVDILGYQDKQYWKRLLKIYGKLLTMSVKQYDAVFVGFAPQLILPLFGWKLKKKHLVMDFFISVYDTMVFDRKKFKEGSICAKLCKWLDEKCIAHADYVISDTNAHGDYFSEEFHVDRDKIHTLYLEADSSIYCEGTVEKPEKLKDKFVVLYFGSILPLQGVEIIMDAIGRLQNDSQLYFYMIGPMKEGIAKVSGENVEYINWLPQDKLAEYISYADLCLAGHFNKDINKAKRTIPGKAYIYQAMGKPMILGDNPATRELYEEGSKIHFVEMGNGQALAEKITELKRKFFDI